MSEDDIAPPPGFALAPAQTEASHEDAQATPTPPSGFNLVTPHQQKEVDYTGWDTAAALHPTRLSQEYSGIRTALEPAPNTTYGSLLPFARDNTTGALRAALPSGMRTVAQGLTDLAFGPAMGTVTPEATMALTNIVPAVNPSVASGTGAAIADAARPQPPQFLSSDFRAAPGVTEPQTLAAGETTSVTAPAVAAPNPTFQIPKTAAEAKTIAAHYYQKADDVGGQLTPEVTNKFLDKAQSIGPQTPEGQLIRGESPITQLTQRIEGMRDQPISLRAAQEIDEGLGDIVDKEYGLKGLSKDGRNVLDLQSAFRSMIQNAGPEDTVGGTEGFAALKDGRAAWSQAAKMGDLERIQTRAQLSDNPATAIKSGIRTLLSNPQRARGYTPEEVSALKSAANRGILGGTLHVFGYRMIPAVAGAAGFVGGGVPGAVATAMGAQVGSSLMRRAAAALQTNRLDNALGTLGARVPGTAAPETGMFSGIAGPSLRGIAPYAPTVAADWQQGIASGGQPSAGGIVP